MAATKSLCKSSGHEKRLDHRASVSLAFRLVLLPRPDVTEGVGLSPFMEDVLDRLRRARALDATGSVVDAGFASLLRAVGMGGIEGRDILFAPAVAAA